MAIVVGRAGNLAVAVIALSGCGRIWFDGSGGVGDGDGGLLGNDATAIPATVFIEAEDFAAMTMPVTDAWVFRTDVPGYSGTGFMLASPDSSTCLEAPLKCPALSYEYDVATSGLYNFFVRVYAADAAAETMMFGDEDEVEDPVTATQLGSWHWVHYNPTAMYFLGAGGHDAVVWMQDGGLRFDAIAISTLATPPAL
ncbi:MAG: hypothetical protein AB7R00_16920 [Kofleriaceae bacterium]